VSSFSTIYPDSLVASEDPAAKETVEKGPSVVPSAAYNSARASATSPIPFASTPDIKRLPEDKEVLSPPSEILEHVLAGKA
jgi:hypothetical protein